MANAETPATWPPTRDAILSQDWANASDSALTCNRKPRQFISGSMAERRASLQNCANDNSPSSPMALEWNEYRIAAIRTYGDGVARPSPMPGQREYRVRYTVSMLVSSVTSWWLCQDAEKVSRLRDLKSRRLASLASSK